ncbi:MAG: aspartate-semialdehyde dehydrogenase [Gemmatimonadetes bacterium]|nr:MAG: aspartate-semialdehyde dehydrogenase [Gemmatimonadota bacterium]
MAAQVRVGILGATGTVGQRLVAMLEGHPQLVVTAVAASDRSQGKTFGEACVWRLPGNVPSALRALQVRPPEPPLDCDIVLSSLPADTAGPVEAQFAAAGYPVISNSSSHRMDDDVPLLIPEVNAGHLAMIARRSGRGFIVTNPNCSTIMIALALAPLQSRFGVEAGVVTTMQAISGAGYPGVASLDITDNVVPYIASEEEKIERETLKILGRVDGGGARGRPAEFPLSELGLHTAPLCPILVRDEPDRPQPRLDRDAGGGMSITIGRIARDRVLSHRFVALSHNTIRGAAGAAILNAELLAAEGYLSGMINEQ